MAFHGDGQKLIGEDGYVQRATFGSEIIGDGATPLPDGLTADKPAAYLIIAVATPTGFPPAISGGNDPAVGDVLMVELGITIVPHTGDDVVELILEDQCDISSWQMAYKKPEIPVTTLCDLVEKYRAGLADMAGKMDGVFTVGITDEPDGLLRQFIRIARQDGEASFDSWNQQEAVLLGFFYVNHRKAIADLMYVVAPFQMYGLDMGAKKGAAQTFGTDFRFANLKYVSIAGVEVALEPTFYRLGDASST